MVAVMACIESFGNQFIFENTDPKLYESWTRESVRAMSNELLSKDSEEISSATNSNSKLPVDESAGEDQQRPYPALVNEECQKRKLPLPNYELFGETCGGVVKFRCRVSDFSTFPAFRSDKAHSSKRAVKNEAAKHIYEWMKQGTRAKESHSQVVFPVASELDISADFVPFDKLVSDSNNSLQDSIANPRNIIPFVMTFLSQISKSCYPELSPNEGINQMIDEMKQKSQEIEKQINLLSEEIRKKEELAKRKK